MIEKGGYIVILPFKLEKKKERGLFMSRGSR